MMRRLAWVLAGSLAGWPAYAQIVPPAADPGAIQQRQIEDEQRRRALERLERKPVTDPLERPEVQKRAPKAAPKAIRFKVNAIEFSASEILAAAELEAIARDYRGREISLAELQELAERVNDLYRAKGVVTARAVIPPQDVSDGVVRIRLVEGRYGEISLRGNENTSAGYVTWRLGQTPGSLVDLEDLEQELIRFNRTTDAQLQAELKPGQAFGTTDLHLAIHEPPRHDLRVFIDNAGADSTGEWRRGITYLNRSLLGWRDDFTLSTTRSDGVESYSIGYGVPINRWGGRARYAYYKDHTEIEHGPLAPLDITGKSRAHVLSLRQPVHVAPTMQVDLTGGYTWRDSENWIDGVFLQGTRTKTGNIGAELQLIGRSGYLLANYFVTAGHADVDAVGRNSYTIGRGSLRGIYNLGSWSARGLIAFQHSPDRMLPSSEQFFIGGEGSVRGYPFGVYAGEEGYTASVELHHPLFGAGSARGGREFGATGFVFADYGRVEPFRPPNSTLRDYEQLSSAGFGVTLAVMERVSARVTFAYALNDLPDEPRRYVVHFQLVAAVF